MKSKVQKRQEAEERQLVYDSKTRKQKFTCVICGGEVNYFRDELSAREYRISKMCQKCQDSVFGS